MSDPRVQERDNPLVRRLNAVAQANVEMGTALGGGARPPRPAPLGPVQGGSATVLPPPAVPLTPTEAINELPPAEAEELEKRWAADPSNPANRPQIVAGQPLGPNPDGPFPPTTLSSDRYVPAAGHVISNDYLSMIAALPLTEEQRQTIRLWVFEGAAKNIMLEAARRLDEMQAAFGLAPKEETDATQGPGETEGMVAGMEKEELEQVPGKQTPIRSKSKRKSKPAKGGSET